MGCLRVGRGCFFEGGIEDFDLTLGAEVAEPVVEEGIDLLLEKDLLDARGDSFEGRDLLTLAIERNQFVVVVGCDLLLGDADSLTEAEFNEAENLEAVAERGLDKLLG
jgi:hypothetical protein